MLRIYPFRALRPKVEIAPQVASLPYDVMNREEAFAMAKGNPVSMLRVTRSEIELPLEMDVHDEKVYKHARAVLDKFEAEGTLVQDASDCLYVYRQTMQGREQYGLVVCVEADQYYDETIKKHELTRADKEEDRLQHVLTTNCQTGPVFLTYRDHGQYAIFSEVCKEKALYDFTASDGIGHTVWKIEDKARIQTIRDAFGKVPFAYIADGHHRSAAGARSARARAAANPNHKGTEEYNRFQAILFPSTQLKIFDYNRLLKDLNGNDAETLLKKLGEIFKITPLDTMQSPAKINQVNLYLQGKWYACEFLPKHLQGLDVVGALDVALLQNLVLQPIFGIDDPRTSKGIDFVGGIRGLGELVKRVDSGEMACAFAMHATTLDQLMAIADAGQIMPPKSTWFEPKLRDGLLIHRLD
jgi:uncharacterized protein (DUF1015 family)